MSRISKSVRFEILTRDGYRCRYCGATAQDCRLEVDHVVSVYRGGADDPSNLVTACQDCNAGKSDRALEQAAVTFVMSPDRRPGRLARIAKAAEIAKPSSNIHELNTGEIDELDEIDGDCQLAFIWCNTHQHYESHSIPIGLIGSGSIVVRRKVIKQ